ncbi:hypothetical protein CRD82_01805 [Escherichia coli]|nr:hypothetical protein [Escherichia coli]RFQ37653.1 hypothetical protein CRD82_01805 [Escherichia coli]
MAEVASCALLPYRHNCDLQQSGPAGTITMMAESEAPDNPIHMAAGPEYAFRQLYLSLKGPHQKFTPPTRYK